MSYFSDVHTHILGRIQRRRRFPLRISQRKMLLLSIDILLINTALLLGFNIRLGINTPSPDFVFNPLWFIAITLLWLAIASANDNYDIKQASKLNSTTFATIKSITITSAILAAVFLILPQVLVNWLLFFLVTILIASILTLWRALYATFLSHPTFIRRTLIAGDGVTGQAIVKVIEEYNSGYEIMGYIPFASPKNQQGIQGLKRLNDWSNLISFVHEYNVSDIILTTPHNVQSKQMQMILACFEKGVRIVPMPEIYEEITGRIPVEYIDGRWLTALPINRDSNNLYLFVKRVMDIIIACIGLLILLPFFPLFIMAIKLDSPGPAFYRPVRQGQGGKSIRLWKFRTMVSGADKIGDPTFTSKKDTRITRFGRLLRLSHMDELPQFINIIAGHMSLVGPRPERYVPEMEAAIPFYRTRFAVKPGATGWALVKQGYAEGLDDTLIKLQYDLYYIKHQTLTLDVIILCKSIMHMLTMGGQ